MKIRTQPDYKNMPLCHYYGYEPNENLEAYLTAELDLKVEEIIEKNKGKTYKEIEAEEMLQDVKKELFG